MPSGRLLRFLEVRPSFHIYVDICYLRQLFIVVMVVVVVVLVIVVVIVVLVLVIVLIN